MYPETLPGPNQHDDVGDDHDDGDPPWFDNPMGNRNNEAFIQEMAQEADLMPHHANEDVDEFRLAYDDNDY